MATDGGPGRKNPYGGVVAMMHSRRVMAKLCNLFRNERAEKDLAREIASHLSLLEDEFQRRGMTPAEARLAARRAYGGTEQAKQLHRDERSILWLEQTLQDLRHACRSLARSPGFTLASVITLALGVGVNTTLFSAYNAVALKPLPVTDAKRVVRLERWLESGMLGEIQYDFSYLEYVHFRDHQDVFSNLMAASWPVRVLASLSEGNQQGGNALKTLQGEIVSGNYFTGLGISTRIGRTFGPEEDRAPGANPVIVLSYAFWQREFQGDTQIPGRTMKVNGTLFTIVGVAPPEFTGTSVIPQVPDFWAPVSMQAQLVPGQNWLNRPTDFRFQVLARMKPMIGLKEAQAEADTLIHQFSATYPPRDRTRTVTLQRTAFFGNTDDIRFQAGVATSMLIVGMVLFVACANVANMLLARGAARQKEMSVRMALGASRSRVIRHLLTESVLLSLGGGIAGLALAIIASKLLWVWFQQMLNRMLGEEFVFCLNLNPDARVLAYALGLSVITGIVFGLSPAVQFTKRDLTTALKGESSSFGRRVSRSRLRHLLVGGQVAVSMLLLTSAGLLVRGLARSQTADPGFQTRQLVLLSADFGDDPAKAAATNRRLMDRLATIPELNNIAMGTAPMMGTWTPPIVVKQSTAVEGMVRSRTLASYASETYFNTLGIILLRGRDFTRQEAATGAHVSVISASTARRFWPGEDPIGKHFQLDLHFDGKFSDFEVIGVAKDIRFANLTRTDPAHVYLATNSTDILPILMSAKSSQSALAAVRNAVAASDKNLLPSLSLWNMETRLLSPRKTMARALAMFAAILAVLALSLAGIGIYGVMAYVVSQRTQEIGVRMALGATRGRVLESVALQGLWPVAAGMMLGIACGAAMSGILHSTLASPESSDFLYGVPYYDPWTFLGVSCFLAMVALFASLVPALHALKVDPLVSLRYE
jgi:macrolide transport system ATP-binding/permease protein